jgi:predicted Zn-dependent protease
MMPGMQTSPTAPASRPRFLSESDCQTIAHRLARAVRGGGESIVTIISKWAGNVRWARNRVTTTGEDRDNKIVVTRSLRGAKGSVAINTVTDEALVAATRQAERLMQRDSEKPEYDLAIQPQSPFQYWAEPAAAPQLFIEATYQQDAGQRAEAARRLMQSAKATGMLSAGYIQVSATSLAYITSWGYADYEQYTWAQYSVTVREPHGTGSGWAGVDWLDWTKIDGDRISAIALEKCLTSRNPVAVEPGRYTTILESQAVCDFVGPFMFHDWLDRGANERSLLMPFHKSGENEPDVLGGVPLARSRLGERVMDERISISTDPLDPELGFPLLTKMDLLNLSGGEYPRIFHPTTWIDHGVLRTASYEREYAIRYLGRDLGMPNSGAFRMSGGATAVEEMIATTERGLLVTRFDQVDGPDGVALVCRGYTRDGLWLIENGKISKPVKNMLFVESVLFALNNVDQLGPPQRVFHPVMSGKFGDWWFDPQPVIVPPLKIRDFSFTALSEAI